MSAVVNMLDILVRCRHYLRKGEKEGERLGRLAQREMDQHERSVAVKEAKDELVHRAAQLDAKWLAQEREAVAKRFHKERLYSILQEEQDLGRHRKASKAREDPRSIKLLGFLQPEGVPITAERASEVFGTKVPDLQDYTPQLRQWKAAACDYDEGSRLELEERDRMLSRARQKDWELRMERWRDCMHYLDGRRTNRILWERQEVLKKQLRRQEKRECARKMREELEAEVRRRQAEQEAEERERRRRVVEELVHEEEERRAMMEAESEQCHVDSFWGFVREERRREALEEARRKQRHRDKIYRKDIMARLNLIAP